MASWRSRAAQGCRQTGERHTRHRRRRARPPLPRSSHSSAAAERSVPVCTPAPTGAVPPGRTGARTARAQASVRPPTACHQQGSDSEPHQRLNCPPVTAIIVAVLSAARPAVPGCLGVTGAGGPENSRCHRSRHVFVIKAPADRHRSLDQASNLEHELHTSLSSDWSRWSRLTVPHMLGHEATNHVLWVGRCGQSAAASPPSDVGVINSLSPGGGFGCGEHPRFLRVPAHLESRAGPACCRQGALFK